MPVSQADLDGRDIDLEKTYVHDVYNHMSALRYPGQRNGHRWPKVNKFLNELEPGSIVCDVGCGSGKYLRVNSGIYKVGVDICKKLTQVAKDDDKEIILCDNLTLPFRDETFDAVLSIAVIHHFANPERRICALRELARILRVGGRLVITVWAMEQKHRKFPSQDVLVPCCQPQYLHNSSIEVSTSTTATSEEDFATPLRLSLQGYEPDYIYPRSSSSLTQDHKGKTRLQLFRSLRSIKTSPSSSSLSSPNETCYSFVRKALQKLSRSGSKREKHPSGTWFLDSLTSLNRDDLPTTRYDPEGCEQDDDVQNIPIEIIRMEKDSEKARAAAEKPAYRQLLDVLRLPQKSRSMNDIPRLEVLPASPRSRSSASGIDLLEMPCLIDEDDNNNNNNINNSASKNDDDQEQPDVVENNTLKPKLVKQKQSVCEECDDDLYDHHHLRRTSEQSVVIISEEKKPVEERILDIKEETKTTTTEAQVDAIEDKVKTTVAAKLTESALLTVAAAASSSKQEKSSFNMLKQKSLTEEIMSADRLLEKEHVRQNIQKQASLNEELIYRASAASGRHKSSIDSIKETIFPPSAARKFQLFRSGLTSKLKSSTTSIEKVTGGSIKSGFARIFQNLTGVGGEASTGDRGSTTGYNSNGNGNGNASSAASGSSSSSRQQFRRDELMKQPAIRKSSSEDKGTDSSDERRCSHEENSDSSKDNSLQSDTSVDSEDSVVSVIERVMTVVKSPSELTTTAATSLILPVVSSSKIQQHQVLTGVLSHPSSPKVAQNLQYQNAKGKALSLPASPRNLVLSPSIKFKIPAVAQTNNGGKISTAAVPTKSLPPTTATTTTATPNEGVAANISFTYDEKQISSAIKDETQPSTKLSAASEDEDQIITRPLLKLSPMDLSSTTGVSKLKVFSDKDVQLLSEKLTLLSEREFANNGPSAESEPRGDICEGDESEKSDIEPDATTRQSSSDITKKSNGVATAGYKIGNLPRSVYALIKRSSSGPGGTVATRLPSYELFNPEIEDVETDSSGVSTPDSVDSVISVKVEDSEEQPRNQPVIESDSRTKASIEEMIINTLPENTVAAIDADTLSTEERIVAVEPKIEEPSIASEPPSLLPADQQTFIRTDAFKETRRITTGSRNEIIKPSTSSEEFSETSFDRDTKKKETEPRHERPPLISQPSMIKSPTADETWGNECRQYLVEFADNLSEKLLAEIDRYKERGRYSTEFVKPEYTTDPYLTKLSEELHHVSKLSKELSQDYDIIKPMASSSSSSGEVSRETEESSIMEERIAEESPVDIVGGSSVPNVSIEESEELPSEMEERGAAAANKEEKLTEMLTSQSSTDPESPGSVEGWLDSRRNTIESKVSKEKAVVDGNEVKADDEKELLLLTPPQIGETKFIVVEESEIAQRRSIGNKETTSLPSDDIVLPDECGGGGKIDSQPRTSIESIVDDRDYYKRRVESGASKLKSESIARSSLESDVSSVCSDASRTVRKYRGSRAAELALRGAGGSDSVESSDTCGDDITTTSGGRAIDRKYRGSRTSDLSLRAGESIDSNDTCDSWERTGSAASSDFSRQNTESRSVITQSSASLASWSDCSKDIRFADRRTARCDGRSSSEETNSPRGSGGAVLIRQKGGNAIAQETPEKKDSGSADMTLSGSTSQDSLTSESGGGSVTVHCFYHVFREGELNRLIDEYVENLHIISSYYDHSNWCVIAEKVQVWTI